MIAALGLAAALAGAVSPPSLTPKDRQAIQAVLDSYATAVSSRDRTRFEALLIAKDIPFAYVPTDPKDEGSSPWRDYADFRRGVFGGAGFDQSFQDVDISGDGALASVHLIFVNKGPHSVSWGWKTLQLLKVDGRWKIASEFYTGHGGAPPSPPEPADR